MTNAFIIHEKDTVATVTDEILEGDNISYIVNGQSVVVKALVDIPKFHKVSIKNVKKGDGVIKYGERIGYAVENINLGDHVHTHNLNS